MTARLLIGTPCPGGQVSSLYARSILNFQAACRGNQEVRLEAAAQWVDSLATRARQGLITQFLGHPTATHLLFIDATVGFWPDQVFRLLKFDAEAAAAAIPRKSPRAADSAAPKPHFVFDYEPDESPASSRDGFVKAREAGLGFMLLKRSALRALTEKYTGLRYHSDLVADPADPRYFSYALFNGLDMKERGRTLEGNESFCRRWTDMGGEIWVDLESALKGVSPVIHGTALYGPGGAPLP